MVIKTYENRKCKCRLKSKCQLNGECLTDVLYTNLHLKYPIIALFTMELLEGSSKLGITTIETRSNTLNA